MQVGIAKNSKTQVPVLPFFAHDRSHPELPWAQTSHLSFHYLQLLCYYDIFVLRPSGTSLCEVYMSHVKQQVGNIRMLITTQREKMFRLIPNWMLDSVWVWYNISFFLKVIPICFHLQNTPFSQKTTSFLDNIVDENPGGEHMPP